MFNAYPQQRTSWKFVVPLCLAGGLCLVLYASFEASEDDRPLSSDDPSLKRMQPFLSSQSFEIGLWTRQKPTGDETSTAPDMSRSSAEVERLRQQLLLERSRIAEQSAEIARLRGSVTPQPAQTVQDFDPTVHIAADTKESDASIPDSLWREPPLLDKEATSSSRLEKQWNYDDSPPQTGGSTREALKAVEKENTITVKAGDREIVLQISKPETTLEPPSHRPGSEVLETSFAEVGNSTQQVLASPRSNFSDSVSDASGPPSGPPSSRDSEKSATQITVRSGQQSIVIQVRDGSEEVRLPPRAEDKAPDKELSLNNTSGAPMVLPEVETAKAVPELPEPSALPQDTTLSLSPEGPGPSLRGVQGIQGAPERSLPEEEAATTTKGYSAYANLAFRTR